jgi:hypothetical protein
MRTIDLDTNPPANKLPSQFGKILPRYSNSPDGAIAGVHTNLGSTILGRDTSLEILPPVYSWLKVTTGQP